MLKPVEDGFTMAIHTVIEYDAIRVYINDDLDTLIQTLSLGTQSWLESVVYEELTAYTVTEVHISRKEKRLSPRPETCSDNNLSMTRSKCVMSEFSRRYKAYWRRENANSSYCQFCAPISMVHVFEDADRPPFCKSPEDMSCARHAIHAFLADFPEYLAHECPRKCIIQEFEWTTFERPNFFYGETGRGAGDILESCGL
jgi:hypothetical protein